MRPTHLSRPQAMRTLKRLLLTVIVCSLLLLCSHLVKTQDVCETGSSDCSEPAAAEQSKYSKPLPLVHLSVVACGDRLEESMIMIKSAVILSTAHVMVHIFADDDLRPVFQKQLETWPDEIRSHLSFKLYPISFPTSSAYKPDEWRKLFKPCASQRLFIPDILRDVDSVLYVDTDILFMRPIEDVWDHFKHFNSSQIAALSPEHESPNAGWYNRFARHPYYGKLGVNSGVMLMNLTRMRQVGWLDHIIPYYKEYKLKITWGDQDLINIFFHYFPDKLYIYNCDWNYRPDHCMYMSNCKQAESNGVSVLHGCRGVYHNEKQPVFKSIYEAFRDYKFGDDLSKTLLAPMLKSMSKHSSMPCGKIIQILVGQLKQYAIVSAV